MGVNLKRKASGTKKFIKLKWFKWFKFKTRFSSSFCRRAKCKSDQRKKRGGGEKEKKKRHLKFSKLKTLLKIFKKNKKEEEEQLKVRWENKFFNFLILIKTWRWRKNMKISKERGGSPSFFKMDNSPVRKNIIQRLKSIMDFVL